MNRLACALFVVLSAVALGEDPKAKAAREELERQLNQMVGKVPTRVRVEFIGLEEPNYIIEDASFELDGKPLTPPLNSKLSEEGTHPVWNGEVTPGKHSVKVMLVVANRTSAVLSDEGGYKWTLRGERTADVHAGIEVHVEVTARRDGTQPDVGKRFALATSAKPVMIATLDDGSMPEALKKPVVAVVDAGTPGPTAEQLAEQKKKKEAEAKAAEVAEAKRLAEEEKKARVAAAAEAKRLAAEEKKAKAAEALEAKRAAAAAKKEKAAAALAAKKAAAEEKKRAAAEAAAEKKRLAEEKKLAALAAAEEKKRLAQEALEAKNKPPPVAGETAPVDAGAPAAVAAAEPIDAGVPEPVDAGAPQVVAAAPVDAGTPTPVAAAPEEEGPPWLLIGIAGAIAALIFLVVVARKRARPPTLDD